MNLMQISEPDNGYQIKKDDHAVGIDFGTTNCVCTYYYKEKFKIILDEYKKPLIPSVVAFLGKNVFVGNQALENKDILKENYISSVKRLLTNDLDKKLNLPGTDYKFSAIEISSMIFDYIKKKISSNIKKEVKKCVITVPAYFDELSRTAVKKAAINAGFEVLRLINEPTAAALAYGLEKSVTGHYFVYDLGGGTFDVSLLKLSDGIFRVLRTGGDVNLGGDDIDYEIAKILCKKYFHRDLTDLKNSQKINLIMLSKKVKENIDNNIFKYRFDFFESVKEIIVDKEDVYRAADKLIDKTIKISKQVLLESELDISEIKGFILVGGSTKLYYLRNKLLNSFDVEFFNDINPEIIVAQGAATHADSLINGSKNLLLDVTPLSLGIETAGGLMEKIIERNSTIPISKEQEFTTYENGQTAIKIRILQGEREICEYNRTLGEFVLSGIEPMPAGIPRIKVRFSVDSDGILDVSAYEEQSGKKNFVEVKPIKKINSDDMVMMIKDSVENSKKDMEERSLREAIVDGQRCLNELEYLKKEIKVICSKQEQTKIFLAMDDLKSKISNTKKNEIKSLIERLNLLTQNFAQKRIESSIGSTLVGKDLDSLEG